MVYHRAQDYPPFVSSVLSCRTADYPSRDFRIRSPEAACYLGLSEFQKRQIRSQEHCFVSSRSVPKG